MSKLLTTMFLALFFGALIVFAFLMYKGEFILAFVVLIVMYDKIKDVIEKRNSDD